MSYSSSNHSSGRSVKFRDLEDGAGDASGSRTSKMSAALSFDASVGLLSDASASTTSSRRGRLGTPAPLASKASSLSAADAKEDDSPFRFMDLLKQIYALFAALPGYDAFKVKYALLQVVRVVTQLSFLVGLWVLSPSLKPSLDANTGDDDLHHAPPGRPEDLRRRYLLGCGAHRRARFFWRTHGCEGHVLRPSQRPRGRVTC